MPIKYDEEKKGWSGQDLTDLEKEKVIEVGIQTIVTSMGVQYVKESFKLEDFDTSNSPPH
jgi:hypothetical protein